MGCSACRIGAAQDRERDMPAEAFDDDVGAEGAAALCKTARYGQRHH